MYVPFCFGLVVSGCLKGEIGNVVREGVGLKKFVKSF